MQRVVYDCATGESVIEVMAPQEVAAHLASLEGQNVTDYDNPSPDRRALAVDELVAQARKANAGAQSLADVRAVIDATLDGLGAIYGTGGTP